MQRESVASRVKKPLTSNCLGGQGWRRLAARPALTQGDQALTDPHPNGVNLVGDGVLNQPPLFSFRQKGRLPLVG